MASHLGFRSTAMSRLLHLPRREVFLSLRGVPVRRLILQQMLKIAAARRRLRRRAACRQRLRFLSRPHSRIVQDGRVRFYRARRGRYGAASQLAPHGRNSACRRPIISAADYIDLFVVWQKKLCAALPTASKRSQERTGGRRCRASSTSRNTILYGVYADQVLTRTQALRLAFSRALAMA